MFDTAYDLGLPAAAELRAACEHAALKAATVADPDGTTPAETARHAITRTLAVALVAARATGNYDWTVPVDVDQLVTDAAWDHLAQLGRSARGHRPVTQPGGIRQQDDRATTPAS
ncbi:MAG: hypothetical protein ACRDRA_22185 [Pseudonocardiaceae bacterium]